MLRDWHTFINRQREAHKMATDKTYSIVGTSTLNGNTKCRFANDIMRIKVLDKNGHTDIQLVELPDEMTKVEAAKFIQKLPEFQTAERQDAIQDYLDKHDRQPKVEVKAAIKAAVEVKPATVDVELETV
jgi:hypothetical protein